MTSNSSKKPTSKKKVKKNPPKSGLQKSPTKGSASKTKGSGVTPTSGTVRIDHFRVPKPRKGRKGTKYHMYYWFREQISHLPKGKLRKEWEEWLKDPGNGLTW